MKKLIFGILIGFALATTIAVAEQATEHRGMMGGGMMQGTMRDQKSDGGSSMRGMMAMMMQMIERCNTIMDGMMGKAHQDATPQKETPEKK
jgi:hypothetical protein